MIKFNKKASKEEKTPSRHRELVPPLVAFATSLLLLLSLHHGVHSSRADAAPAVAARDLDVSSVAPVRRPLV